MEVPLHKMGDLTRFFDDVTRFTKRTGTGT
jgi:hypothetical protein